MHGTEAGQISFMSSPLIEDYNNISTDNDSDDCSVDIFPDRRWLENYY